MQRLRSSSPVAASPATIGSFHTQQQQQQIQQQQLLQQQQSSPRHLFARLASGLTTKPRSIGEFRIHLDEPHRQFSNGDTVKGHVRLHVLRPVRITHVVISLSGHAHVYKNPGGSGEGGRGSVPYSGGGSGPGRSANKAGGRYHGNGYATLFEDEVVLCGDGRLGDRVYQFNFELQFPTRELPSSIDFERGTIAYTVTATMTRPTTISPTTIDDRRVMFVERIDISPLYPPKARTIILDPVSKRSKAKSQAIKMMDANDRKSTTRSRMSDQQSTSVASVRLSNSSQDGERPLSPVPSELSEESRVSSNGIASQNGSISASPAASIAARTSHSKPGTSLKTISTIIQPCTGGCLRGEHVAINIKVNHSKYMKSMNGIIVTLYRTARVDTEPALPIGPLEGNKKQDEYFSRSITGLGGLSLSGAGSAHVFRKDLAQVVTPLVIKPTTLTADVVVKLRVPEEAFPTISGVPGAMISFKYYLEVIVDIQGRLAAPEKMATNLGELASTTSAPLDVYDDNAVATTSIGHSILNTTHVRRDKGIVSGSFEIVVGTVDSERRKGKQKAELPAESHHDRLLGPLTIPSQPPTFDSVSSVMSSSYDPSQHVSQAGNHYVPYEPSESWPSTYNDYSYQGFAYPPHMPTAPPHMPDESQLSEKERLRLAETRLLPSQPPGMEDDTGQVSQHPSGPRIDETGALLRNGGRDVESDFSNGNGSFYDADAPAPRDEYDIPPVLVNGERHHHHDAWSNGVADGIPASSALQTVNSVSTASINTVVSPTDDKQELERARLQALASAPPTDADGSNNNEDDGTGAVSANAVAGPSAPPALPEEDQAAASSSLHDSHADASGSADLPRYER